MSDTGHYTPDIEEVHDMAKTRFAVYRTNVNAAYAMAYNCGVCGDPAIAYSDDEKGMFVGLCGEGHEATVLAS